MSSQLDYLRTKSFIDCDTLNLSVAETLGPFVDCTSNQAITLSELRSLNSTKLLREAASLTPKLSPNHPTTPHRTLCSEIVTCLLSARLLPHLSGYVHTQTNPHHASSTAAIVSDARRIISIYASLSPPVPRHRVCIKIPATFPGLVACGQLEEDGIRTLATTLFTAPQAVMAGEVGCTYIAPYVNDLRVHFLPGYKDQNPGFEVAAWSQRWYKNQRKRTQVLPASLTSTGEVMRLAGADHITVPAGLLEELARTKYQREEAGKSVSDETRDGKEEVDGERLVGVCGDEAAWTKEFEAAEGGVGKEKLKEAIEIFGRMQDELEEACEKALDRAA